MQRIVVTGAECSGKTSLAHALAAHFEAPWVPEMAREYLDGLGRPYVEQDLRHIAELQVRTEAKRAAEQPHAGLLICDTDLITIRIWGEEKFSRSDPWVVEQTEIRPYDLWLLCTPDIPWVYDPQRENPYDRDRLFEVYERTLKELGKRFAIIHGNETERMRQAVKAIEAHDNSKVSRSGL